MLEVSHDTKIEIRFAGFAIPVSIIDIEKEQELQETTAQLQMARQAIMEIIDLDTNYVANFC